MVPSRASLEARSGVLLPHGRSLPSAIAGSGPVGAVPVCGGRRDADGRGAVSGDARRSGQGVDVGAVGAWPPAATAHARELSAPTRRGSSSWLARRAGQAAGPHEQAGTVERAPRKLGEPVLTAEADRGEGDGGDPAPERVGYRACGGRRPSPIAVCADRRRRYIAKSGVIRLTTVAMSRPPSKGPSVGSCLARVIQAAAWRASTVTMLAAVSRIDGVLIIAAWPR